MRAFLLFLLLSLLALIAVERRWIEIPPEHDPRLPLDVRAPPNWLTAHRLERAIADPLACRLALAGSGVAYVPVADRVRADGCGWTNALRVTRGAFAKLEPATMSCPLALSFAMIERHAFQSAAPIARIDHFGTYACRNVNHAKSGRRSEHARANAFDIAGFVLADGTRVGVAKDWDGAGREAIFLKRAHERACRFARVVLGPDYNARHHDHFHVDMGSFRACR